MVIPAAVIMKGTKVQTLGVRAVAGVCILLLELIVQTNRSQAALVVVAGIISMVHGWC